MPREIQLASICLLIMCHQLQPDHHSRRHGIFNYATSIVSLKQTGSPAVVGEAEVTVLFTSSRADYINHADTKSEI